MNKFSKWCFDKLGITAILEEQKVLKQKLDKLEEDIVTLKRDLCIAETNYSNSVTTNERVLDELNRLTAVDVDTACLRGNNTVILTGVLRGKGYVQFYDMGTKDFSNVASQLRDMQKHQWIRNIDSPINFKGTFDL